MDGEEFSTWSFAPYISAVQLSSISCTKDDRYYRTLPTTSCLYLGKQEPARSTSNCSRSFSARNLASVTKSSVSPGSPGSASGISPRATMFDAGLDLYIKRGSGEHTQPCLQVGVAVMW
ncbi:hypothetical protein MN608_06364 [Microdochium nivale]|nr:hypothetical protein MN608_06364 [Microdochium nivale]